MGSVVIVGAEEPGEGLAAGLVGGVGAFVGPSSEDGLVEAFHFSVGLGSVRPDEFVSGFDLVEGVGEVLAAAIGPSVVGHYPVYAISVGSEPVGGAEHEPGAGLSIIGVKDF